MDTADFTSSLEEMVDDICDILTVEDHLIISKITSNELI